MIFRLWHSTVTGASHALLRTPCQDSCTIGRSADDKWVSIVLCDGCGSAPHSKEGAQFASKYLAANLLNLAERVSHRGPGTWIIDEAITLLLGLRRALHDTFGEDISGYAATIVAALASETGGFCLHLGDGIATSISIDHPGDTSTLQLALQSNPETGEYANQTFYLTDPNWLHHLRIMALPRVDCLVLCTDGAQVLLYEGNRPFGAALVPLLCSLSETNSVDGTGHLREFLAAPRADELTSDDRTLAILATPSFLRALSKIEDHTIYMPDAEVVNGTAAQRDMPTVWGPQEELWFQPSPGSPVQLRKACLRKVLQYFPDRRIIQIAFTIALVLSIATVGCVLGLNIARLTN